MGKVTAGLDEGVCFAPRCMGGINHRIPVNVDLILEFEVHIDQHFSSGSSPSSPDPQEAGGRGDARKCTSIPCTDCGSLHCELDQVVHPHQTDLGVDIPQ